MTGAFLLIAAQDAPTPSAKDATFSEAFSEQSNAAKAVQAAEELKEPAAEPDPALTKETEVPPALAKPVEASPEDSPESPPEAPPEALPAPAAAAEVPPEASPDVEVPPAPAADPSEASAAPAEPAPVSAAAPAKGEPPSRDFMVGVWAEPGKSCEAAMDFKADGTLIGPFRRWELNDGVLTMAGNRQKIWLSVIDQDTMQSRRSETDPPRTLKRCPKAPPPPQP
jgi:hypothetical protein